ncbi:MAG: 1-(5-phosphoribosyl)-5-[(5-phosphoribosylamino)methylideneamino]imidazole-4-carboxamide isomerase [bacterium]|nr:1-(5-phosphoribosyl)-5-[(5-phosphoribosylamino)methylideneamino]imidazole-4-carboxamide isomerase [bacterium]
MLIIPAIDIKNGKVVRLTQGKFDQETIYFDQPYQVAKIWEKQGASIIHVVDLDGAKDGIIKNKDSIEEIIKSINIPIQVGGGIRSLQAMEELFLMGVSRVVLGTASVNNQILLKECVEKFPNRIIVGIDAINGYIAIRGWQERSSFKAVELVSKIEEIGIKEIIYTDILRDGTLSGPNLGELINITQNTKLEVIASGGISKIEDIKKIKNLEHMGIKGIIIGKALYSKKMNLEEAIKVAQI